MAKYQMNKEERDILEDSDKYLKAMRHALKQYHEFQKMGSRFYTKAMTQAKKRIRLELKEKIKTLPRRRKNGDRMTYSIHTGYGYIESHCDSAVPFIKTTVYKKAPKKNKNDDIVKAIRHMAEKIGYTIVEK